MSVTLTSPQVAIDKNCIITNNSALDILVLDAFADDDSPSPEQVYQQNLKPLSTSDGRKLIKAGMDGTVILDDYHTDTNGNQAYNKIYNLIFARADNLYPVTVAGEMLSLKTNNFAPVTLTADEAKNMQSAEAFQQTIMAYPSSAMAKGFQDALAGAGNNANDSDSIDEAVATFFKTTRQYQAVTLDMIVAISTYYNQFPYVWADYKSSKTYYLYSSDGTNIKDCGSLKIAVPSGVPASTDKTLPGFTFTYADASGNQKSLYYSNGQFVDDVKSDMPSICLQGSFILKSQLTKNSGDTSIISVLGGTVNTDKVLGYDQKQDAHGDWSGLYTLLHPKNANDWIQLILMASGLYMAYEIIEKKLKGQKDEIKKTKYENGDMEPGKPQMDSIKLQMKEMELQMRIQNQKLLDKFNDGLKLPDSSGRGVADFQTRLENRMNEDTRSLLNDMLDQQGELLEQLAQYQVDQKVEDIADRIANNQDTLNNTPTESLPDVLPEVKSDIIATNTDLASEVKNADSKISAEAKESMKEAQRNIDESKEAADANEKNSEDVKDGDVGEDLDFPVRLEV